MRTKHTHKHTMSPFMKNWLKKKKEKSYHDMIHLKYKTSLRWMNVWILNSMFVVIFEEKTNLDERKTYKKKQNVIKLLFLY